MVKDTGTDNISSLCDAVLCVIHFQTLYVQCFLMQSTMETKNMTCSLKFLSFVF
jgi:hypothetical protein